jgi:hypothetical protein
LLQEAFKEKESVLYKAVFASYSSFFMPFNPQTMLFVVSIPKENNGMQLLTQIPDSQY